MISAIGHLGLCGAVLVAASAILASVAALRNDSPAMLRAARGAIALLALLFTVVSAALVVALVRSDFRFAYVVGYTERALPIGYKLAAFWAGQQGSLLLWAWLLAVLCFIADRTFRRLRHAEHAMTIGAMAVIVGFFAALLLFAADPFAPVAGAVPLDGRGLNPQLQDPGMIAHPPLLFLGYAGYAIPFAVLVGVLVAGRADDRWLADIRRWLLVAWLFLTAGIVLGAWWAYIELGWGGYWAWDPVENASLLPWLTGTGLLHSVIAQQHRGMFRLSNALLIAVSFILCIVGTFLTRSGVIDSVHAFAPSLIGTFFLGFMILLVVGTVAVLGWRRRLLQSEHEIESLLSREGAFLLGNMLLVIMMLTTLIGTIFPLLSGLVLPEPITVKPPFYNKVVAPMALLLVGLMALGPVLAFGRNAGSRILRSLVAPAAGAAVATVLAAFLLTTNPWALACTFIAVLGTATVIVDFGRSVGARRRSTGEGIVTAALRLVDRDHRRYGGQLAHLGVMMLVVGVAGSSLFGVDQILRLQPGDSAEVGRFEITYEKMDQVREVNYTAVQATVIARDGSGATRTLRPQARFYDAWGEEPNTEVAMRSNWREDLYVSLSGWEQGGAIAAIQVRVNPLVLWIWIGGIVMVLGCLFCILPRLLPQPRPASARAAATRKPATPSLVTAEPEAAP